MSLVSVVANSGDYANAETIARSITQPDQQAFALLWLVRAAAEAGVQDLAEAITCSITHLQRRADALLIVAKHSPRPRSLRAVAEVLSTSSWQFPVSDVLRLEPDAVTAINAELAVAWRFEPLDMTPQPDER
ncbi:hypothetical protein [Amycolatopsis sp. lyj-23]|uniref:hypothetical protein n=1 Tax=Amycolatopsis sp. lyj-23 TaxID=2789283 RepID=UPI0039796087